MSRVTKGSVKDAFDNFKIFEAVVQGVNKETGEIYIVRDATDSTDPEVIPPVYYGGMSGTGLFQHPEEGDLIICCRVYPGGKGITQALRVIPKAAKGSVSRSNRVKAGTPSYPALNPGEIKLAGFGGARLDLLGAGETGAGVFLGNAIGDGIHIKSNSPENTALTFIADSIRSVSGSTREVSRAVYRFQDNDPKELVKTSSSEKYNISALDAGLRRGCFPGSEASSSKSLGGFRNAAISEYRFVANEFIESENFEGWDLESEKRDSTEHPKISSKKALRSVSSENALHLSPHQIVEVIIGNVVNRRGEVLDINYSPIIIGDSQGRPFGAEPSVLYEDGGLRSRRGIGYHFQLSTNSRSNEISNSYNNFIFSLDKEGALKVNVPATSNTGNILYPAKAEFYKEDSGKVVSTYSFPRKIERIPITLKDPKKGIVFPPEDDVKDFAPIDGDVPVRYTGVRYSNDGGYFKGFSGTSPDKSNIRMNPTKHHNMYAAAELLIANTITYVQVPTSNAKCTGYIPGNISQKSFELRAEADTGSFTQIDYMSTVGVFPGKPAISTGGGTVVAGAEYHIEEDPDGNRTRLQYTNDFTVTPGDSGADNTDASGEPRLDPGGKSANINFEGAIEMSVGRDNEDKKSILLDAAGAMVAWFGKDANNRSLIVQTDGDALFNIGGHNGDSFNKGRLDIRVNVNDKGFVGDDVSNTHASDYVISISENGLVIAGMNPKTPMIIRNDGNLNLESAAKLILSAQTIELREGNRPARKSHKGPESTDTPDAASIESVALQLECLVEAVQELLDE